LHSRRRACRESQWFRWPAKQLKNWTCDDTLVYIRFHFVCQHHTSISLHVLLQFST
jgi:hypothetical protein